MWRAERREPERRGAAWRGAASRRGWRCWRCSPWRGAAPRCRTSRRSCSAPRPTARRRPSETSTRTSRRTCSCCAAVSARRGRAGVGPCLVRGYALPLRVGPCERRAAPGSCCPCSRRRWGRAGGRAVNRECFSRVTLLVVLPPRCFRCGKWCLRYGTAAVRSWP